MSTLNLYVNWNSGSPKMWVYSTIGGNTHIAWGSCFQRGHQTAVKDANYGTKTAHEKQAKGYAPCGCYNFTGSFDSEAAAIWRDLRSATVGAVLQVDPDRAAALRDCLDAAHESSAKRNVTTAATPVAPTPPPVPSKPRPQIDSILRNGAKVATSSYDW